MVPTFTPSLLRCDPSTVRRKPENTFNPDVPDASEMAESERSDILFAYGMFFARSKGHRMPGWAATCARGACSVLAAAAVLLGA